MYIDERLLKILETHKGETADVNFIISLIKTIAKEYETEQLRIGVVVGQSEQLFCPHCGNKKQLKVETDLNSDRVCKSRLCAK